MRNTVLTCLFLPLFGFFSLPAAATQNASSMEVPEQVTQQAPQASLHRLDLNQADAPTLQKELNGIGKTKAEAIVAYREANGPFTSVDELLEIKGIGKALLERNRDKLKVE